jgi:dienelactone hydrolase
MPAAKAAGMLLSFALFATMGLVPPLPGGAIPLTLTAADGVKVFAQNYPGPAASAPVILLFHQAGSGKSEYAPIAPRLAKLGYNVLAIDQRSGGDMYAPPNQTVATLGKSEPYMDALRDLEAALAWARATHPSSRVYVWGSSYSASLVFLLAAKHPQDIAAVLAFSPGEYLPDKGAVHAAARQIRVPVFIDSASDPGEIATAHSIGAAVPGSHTVVYVPVKGVHGSSTLREDADPQGAAANWAAVTAFLAGLPK